MFPCEQDLESPAIQQLKVLIDVEVVVDSFGWTALHKASNGFSTIGVTEQLQLDSALINQPDVHGRTPLHFAVLFGSAHDVEVLLEHGAKANQKEKTGRSPLMYACQRRNARMAKLLLEHGADPNMLDAWGMSVICWAMCNDASEVFEVLMGHGADVQVYDNDGDSTLHWAARLGRPWAAEVLVGRGSDMNARGDAGATPLLKAISASQPAMINILVREGARFDIFDACGRGVLHYAAAYSDNETLHLLASIGIYGVDVDARDADGLTARDIFRDLRDESYVRPNRAPFEDESEAFEALLASVNQPRVEELLGVDTEGESNPEEAESDSSADGEAGGDSEIFFDATERLEGRSEEMITTGKGETSVCSGHGSSG